MAHERGSVNSAREAVVELRLEGAATIECIVDTGFNGTLVLPRKLADQLQLSIIGRASFETVGGALMAADLAEVGVMWLSSRLAVEALVVNSEDALIDTALLDGTNLTIDYIADTVTISSREALV
jgi:clan AA aspartic protease